ncbi:hypothetical protein [Curvibacter phage PCA1]|nr:hypothetical protein [Curvibacter phage PCA1]
MANIYSLKSGNASDTTVWSGGVVPVSGDRVMISSGHIVTLDGTYTWGDDSSATITINTVSTANSITVRGTLKNSRTVNSQLTCCGNLYLDFAGNFDAGTELDPIPAGVTAKYILNDSASPANGKYGLSTPTASLAWGSFRAWGAEKNRRAVVTTSAAANATIIEVDDTTGWLVGDTLIFGSNPSALGSGAIDTRKITAISGRNVTVGAALTYSSPVGRSVFNVTRNVSFTTASSLYKSGISINIGTANATAGIVEIGPCELNLTGGVTNQYSVQALNLYWQSNSHTPAVVKRIYRPVIHDVWSVVGSTVTLSGISSQGLIGCFGNQAYKYTVDGAVVATVTLQTSITTYSGSGTRFRDLMTLRSQYPITTGFSQGAVGVEVADSYFEGNELSPISGSGISLTYSGVVFNGVRQLIHQNTTTIGEHNYRACNMGGSQGLWNTVNAFQFASGTYVKMLFDGCTIPAFSVARGSCNLQNIKSDAYVMFRAVNNNPNTNFVYKSGGFITQDNALRKAGRSSLAMYPWYSTNTLFHTTDIAFAASETRNFKINARFNSTYGVAVPPKILVISRGVTIQTITAPAQADTWHALNFTVTNPESFANTITLRFEASSAANTDTAACWFDGIPVADFISWVRHYGSKFDPSNPSRVADSLVQLTEAQASALTGISYSGNTLTVSGTRTMREVYDWMQWYESTNLLTPILSSTDGVSFSLAANMVVSGQLTGSGTLDIGVNTLTLTGESSLTIKHAGGTYVRVAIAAPALIAGSRVQLYSNVEGELYNGVLASNGLTFALDFPGTRTIRLRADHATKLPIEVAGILSSSGLTFLDVQSEDTVYIGNAVDGSTVTEFVPDGPNIQVDINDPDGLTDVQRLYAWMQWYMTTAEGVASAFFGAVYAIDDVNYEIDQTKANIHLDNVSAMPLRVVGGRIARKDGTTIIASNSGSIQIEPGKAYTVKTGVSGLTPAESQTLSAAASSAALAAALSA